MIEYPLILVSEPGHPEPVEVRVRRALKILKRRFGLRAKWQAAETPANAREPRQAPAATDDTAEASIVRQRANGRRESNKIKHPKPALTPAGIVKGTADER